MYQLWSRMTQELEDLSFIELRLNLILPFVLLYHVMQSTIISQRTFLTVCDSVFVQKKAVTYRLPLTFHDSAVLHLNACHSIPEDTLTYKFS